MAVKRSLDHRDALRLLVPGPVSLVSTLYRDQPNVMAASWMLPMSFDPVYVGVAIHPARLTHEFVSKTEVFVINIPTVDLMSAVQAAGTSSGREGDKFAVTGLTPAEAVEIEAPLVAECVGHIECGVIDRHSFGDHDLFVGRILQVQALDEAFGGFWNVEHDAGQLLHHLGGDRYAGLGKAYRVEMEEV
ncbi:MAG TPA: flavin reductase family protein [Thermomicrobiales bacterium]|nr:flavin reductase family protein [Thermomicrobiales bacterium]